MSDILDVYGLTPVQEGMFAQYKMTPDAQLYYVTCLLRISNTLPLSVLRTAVSLLAFRHATLKTAFAVLKSSGQLKQVVLSDREPAFSVLSPDAPYTQSALDDIFNAHRRVPFDLQKDPLIRITAIDFPDARFLLLHAHHIIIDGWSLPLLAEDLDKYCAALLAGAEISALKEEIQREAHAETPFSAYVNFIRAQDTTAAARYWDLLLRDYQPYQSFGRGDNSHRSDAYAQGEISLPQNLQMEIRRFARAWKLTENTVFEGAFGLLLQHFSGERDVIFGKTISGRSIALKNIMRTVGPFINTVPVRMRTAPEESVTDFLLQVQTQSRDSDRYGILPFTDLCKNRPLEKNATDILFVFENYYVASPDAPASGPLSARLVSFREKTEFGLHLTVYQQEDRYKVRAVYGTDRYSDRQIRDLLDSYRYVLTQMISRETKTVSDIHVVTPEQWTEISAFQGPAVKLPEKSVYDLFSECAAADPDSLRITDGEDRYTYTNLLSAAEKTDAFIRARTGGKKQVIGVLCDRSFSQLAAIFGAIRGGSAYLPLSPDFPPERIDRLLKISGCELVLAQEEYLSLTDKAVGIGEILARPLNAHVPAPAAAPDDTLYVIFTSGSTGTPKGAMVTHRSAVNRIGWMANRYFDKNTVVMLKTPYTFDVSVWEIFGFAMYGFSLYILPPGDHYRMGATLDAIARGRVTDLHFVPTVFSSFLEYLQADLRRTEKLSSLRNVFLSGETLRAAQVNTFLSLAPAGVKIHNLYGPAECAVDVTYYDCEAQTADPVPIGRPIDNTKIHILDKRLRPVPVGTTGQICIAGTNVGLGYLNDPARTAAAFVDDPFAKGRLYLTGDLGYWREDGQLVFIGRNDFQIKLHGQRIEPGEIEAAISAVDGVSGAAVILKRDPERLAAFYTGNAAEDAVRKEITRTLPAFMRPGALCRLEALPVNASGKTDRAALDKMPLPQTEEESILLPPENETERAICDAFSEILRLPSIGRNANFYDLGGTSLQLVSLLSRPPLDSLSASDFMRDPTPAGLAKRLDAAQETDYTVLVPLYTPTNAKSALLLFSYAGGDASAYTALTAVFRRRHAETALWYVPWLEEGQYPAAAQEIAKLAESTEAAFYSHCAGAVTAMKLLDLLNRDKTLIRKWTAGGNIPPIPGKNTVNIWKNMPDNMILRFLRHAGLPEDAANDDRQTQAMIRRFRRDTDQFFAYARNKSNVTDVTVHLVLSKTDPFTKNYRQADKRWRFYVRETGETRFIDGASHYFQSQNADELYVLLFNDTKEG